MSLSHYTDVRDIALAHIKALDSLPITLTDTDADGSQKRKRKRLIVITGSFTWQEAVEYLKEIRPELKEYLEKDERGPKFYSNCEFDTTLLKDVTGMEPENMIPWKQCVLETVDALLEWERQQK